MKNLPKAVRSKAIEIANTLLEEKNDIDECILMEIVISQAKAWVKKSKLKKRPMQKK